MAKKLFLSEMLRLPWPVMIMMLLLCGQACHRTQANNLPSASIPRQRNPLNLQLIDSCKGLLQSGDIALRTGADPISYMLRQMNVTDKRFSHCGIVQIENGRAFIYHSVGGEENPLAALKRDSAEIFFNAAANERIGIARLDLNQKQINHLTQIVDHYYTQKIPFDMDFNLADSSRFYCSEFVYRAIVRATGKLDYFSTTILNDQEYVGIDNLFAAPHGGIICDVPFK